MTLYIIKIFFTSPDEIQAIFNKKFEYPPYTCRMLTVRTTIFHNSSLHKLVFKLSFSLHNLVLKLSLSKWGRNWVEFTEPMRGMWTRVLLEIGYVQVANEHILSNDRTYLNAYCAAMQMFATCVCALSDNENHILFAFSLILLGHDGD